MLFRGNTGIIIVDFQQEWTVEDSPFYLGRVSLAAEKCRTLVHEAHQRELPIFYTQRFIENHVEGAFSPIEDRSDLHEKLPEMDVIEVIEHFGWDPFYETVLEDLLADTGVDHLVIGGLAVNAGVRSCVEAAIDRGYEVTLIEDCCSAQSSEVMEYTLKDLQMYRDLVIDVLRDYDEFLGGGT